VSGVKRHAGLFVYPWDFVDEGVDALVGRVRDLGVTHLWLASLYHAGFFLYPHNPRRRTHLLEDGVAYFHPHLPAYAGGPMRPRVAALCAEQDWFAVVCEAAVRAGLRVCAWTVFCHNMPLGLAHPEATIHNAFGDSYPHALSPGHPATVAYCRALAGDLAARYPLDLVLVEAGDYRRRRHGSDWVSGHHHERDGTHLRPLETALLDLSFNPADVVRAQAEGVDVLTLRSTVCRHLQRCFDEAPQAPNDLPASLAEFEARCPLLVDYRASLRAAELALWQQLEDAVHAHGVRLAGAPRPGVDLVLAGAYGLPAPQVEAVARQARQGLLPRQELAVALRLGFNTPGLGTPIASPDELAQAVQAADRGGAHAVVFYNYAESPRRCLDWIPAALATAGLAAPSEA